MTKRKNKLYENPENNKSFEAGATVRAVQPIIMSDKKILVEAVAYPENLYIDLANDHEGIARRLLWRLRNKIQKSKIDLPSIDEEDGKTEFLKHAFPVIVFSFCSLESYANNYIQHNKMDAKYYDETLPDKLDIIAKNLNIPTIKEHNINYWNELSELKTMRDCIIHPLFSYFNTTETNWSELVIAKLLNGKFQWKVRLAYNIIQYFKDNESKIEWPATIHIWARWLQGNPVKK